jgi:hypothetical protein
MIFQMYLKVLLYVLVSMMMHRGLSTLFFKGKIFKSQMFQRVYSSPRQAALPLEFSWRRCTAPNYASPVRSG